MTKPLHTKIGIEAIGNFKKFGLTMLATLLLAFAATAGGSILNISVWDNGPMVVDINGNRYRGDCDLKIGNLAPGNHCITVRKENQNSCGTSGNGQVVYTGTIRIPNNSRVNARVHRNRCLDILSVRRLRPNNGNHYGNNGNYGNGNNGNQGNNGNYGNGSYGGNNGNHGNSGNNGNYGNGSHGGNNSHGDLYDWNETSDLGNHNDWNDHNYENYETGNGGYTTGGYGAYNRMLSDEDLNELMNQINNSWFESNKLEMAKQAIRGKNLRTKQVKRILRKFDYESSKLKFAKHAFAQVVDQEKYYTLDEVFTFNSSIRALHNFIND